MRLKRIKANICLLNTPPAAALFALLAPAARPRPRPGLLAIDPRGCPRASDRAPARTATTLWPQISLHLGYSYDRPNQRYFPTEAELDDSWDASVVMSWSFWDFGARASTASAAEHEAHITARSVEKIEDAVTLEVERARQELRREPQRVAATGVEVLDAETELTSARAELLRARAGARLAEARLERARGL